MCLLLKPEVVFTNAFYAIKETGVNDLKTESLREFCSILYSDITSGNTDYKYVYFNMDNDEIDDYLKYEKKFERGIGRVCFVGDAKDLDIDRTNSIYAQDVQEILQQARETFAQRIQAG